MYCKYCGKEIEEDIKFCPYCGKNLQEKAASESAPLEDFVEASAEKSAETAVAQTPAMPAQVEEKKPPKVWTVFSKVSKILGIVCLSASWIPYFGLVLAISLGVPGIVFSCLGRKAKTEETDKMCRIGLTLCIIAIPVSIVFFVVEYALLLGSLIGGSYGY